MRNIELTQRRRFGGNLCTLIAMRFGEDRVAFIKILASVVSIGSEGSVGRKGPIVQVGSSIGITIGPAFKFSRAWQKNLLLN